MVDTIALSDALAPLGYTLEPGGNLTIMPQADGASFTVQGAAGTGGNYGGDITIVGGTTEDGNGGGVSLTGSPGVNRNGGPISITCGDGDGASKAGGGFSVFAGASPSGTAGSATIRAGSGVNGGSATLQAGDSSNADGGALALTAGSSTGGNGWGGDVTISPGLKNGSGVNGILRVASLGTAAPADARLDNSMFSVWLNEAGNALTFKVKYSGGTVKSGSVALS